MALSEKELKIEIEASKNALAAHKRGMEIHEVVIAAFEEKLKLLPSKEMLKELKCTPTSPSEDTTTESTDG